LDGVKGVWDVCSKKEKKNILAHMDHFVDVFRKHGVISELVFDTAGVVRSKEHDKATKAGKEWGSDHHSLIRRRALWINHRQRLEEEIVIEGQVTVTKKRKARTTATITGMREELKGIREWGKEEKRGKNMYKESNTALRKQNRLLAAEIKKLMKGKKMSKSQTLLLKPMPAVKLKKNPMKRKRAERVVAVSGGMDVSDNEREVGDMIDLMDMPDQEEHSGSDSDIIDARAAAYAASFPSGQKPKKRRRVTFSENKAPCRLRRISSSTTQ
jgi:hypothetical protein